MTLCWVYLQCEGSIWIRVWGSGQWSEPFKQWQRHWDHHALYAFPQYTGVGDLLIPQWAVPLFLRWHLDEQPSISSSSVVMYDCFRAEWVSVGVSHSSYLFQPIGWSSAPIPVLLIRGPMLSCWVPHGQSIWPPLDPKFRGSTHNFVRVNY